MSIKLPEKIVKSILELAAKKQMEENSRVVEEPPAEVVPIQPATETQVSAIDLPIMDEDWKPGNRHELCLAMKQLGEMVPEDQIEDFYIRLKKIIDDALDEEDAARMEPRLSKMDDDGRQEDPSFS